MRVYEQHHFSQLSNSLFIGYIQMFFDLMNKTETEGNAGLKIVAKLCLHSMYGKFGYNVENKFHPKIIMTHTRLWELMTGKYNHADFDIIYNKLNACCYLSLQRQVQQTLQVQCVCHSICHCFCLSKVVNK